MASGKKKQEVEPLKMAQLFTFVWLLSHLFVNDERLQ
jgi:hypothetical protein